MSESEFQRNEPAILADVCVILDAEPKKQKNFEDIAVYERGTGRRVARVLHTTAGRW
jgi:hypothetical protein